MKNPIVQGYYADPEARFYDGKYWIYVTNSRDFEKQKNLTAFSSDDMEHWEIHENIVNMEDFPWVWGAVWAPTVVEKDGKYYLIFASNDIHSDDDPGGLEIAVSDSPAGPFRGYLGRPLIGDIYKGAQPIDAHLFKDSDGAIYLYYGGWGHCVLSQMNETMDGLQPLPDGALRREVTPQDYTEAPCMIKRDGTYYFLWSCGKWEEGNYRVYYGKSDTPLETFEQSGLIVQSQETAKAPGHNSFFYIPEKDEYYIVYHRRPNDQTDMHARVLCIDRMYLENRQIKPVIMT